MLWLLRGSVQSSNEIESGGVDTARQKGVCECYHCLARLASQFIQTCAMCKLEWPLEPGIRHDW